MDPTLEEIAEDGGGGIVPALPPLAQEWADQVAELREGGLIEDASQTSATDTVVCGALTMREGTHVAVEMAAGRGFIARWNGREEIYDSLHTLAVNVSPGAKQQFHGDLFAALSKLEQ